MDKLEKFKAKAIIFDKDGTLIDFDAMWGGWVVFLAEQLHGVSGLDVREALCDAMGYDEANKKVLAHGKLAATPMSQLYRLTVEVMQSSGLSAAEAERGCRKRLVHSRPCDIGKAIHRYARIVWSIAQQGDQDRHRHHR